MEKTMKNHKKQKIQPIVNDSGKWGRNWPCICGSGKKFKKCCIHLMEIYNNA